MASQKIGVVLPGSESWPVAPNRSALGSFDNAPLCARAREGKSEKRKECGLGHKSVTNRSQVGHKSVTNRSQIAPVSSSMWPAGSPPSGGGGDAGSRPSPLSQNTPVFFNKHTTTESGDGYLLKRRQAKRPRCHRKILLGTLTLVLSCLVSKQNNVCVFAHRCRSHSRTFPKLAPRRP
eukprot:COSAG06_NODE_3940_length_4742_cov_3.387680_1_plen_178_part_00